MALSLKLSRFDTENCIVLIVKIDSFFKEKYYNIIIENLLQNNFIVSTTQKKPGRS